MIRIETKLAKAIAARTHSESGTDFETIVLVFIASPVARRDVSNSDAVRYTAHQNTVNTTNATWKDWRTHQGGPCKSPYRT